MDLEKKKEPYVEIMPKEEASLLTPEQKPAVKKLAKEAGYVALGGAFSALAQWAMEKQVALTMSSQDDEKD